MQTFMPSPRPSLNSHMCAWNRTAAGDKTDQFIIGIAIMRRASLELPKEACPASWSVVNIWIPDVAFGEDFRKTYEPR